MKERMLKDKNPQSQNARTFIHKLRNRAHITLAAPLLLFFWLYLEWSSNQLRGLPLQASYINIVEILGLMSGIIVLGWGIYKHKILIKMSQMQPLLSEKLEKYKDAKHIIFIALPVAALLSSAAFYVTANIVFAVLFSVVLIMYSVYNPSEQRLMMDIKADETEREIIKNGIDIELDDKEMLDSTPKVDR